MTNHDSTICSLKQAVMWKILGECLSDYFVDVSYDAREQKMTVEMKENLSLHEQLLPLKQELDALGERYSLSQAETKETRFSSIEQYEESQYLRINFTSSCLSYSVLFYENIPPLPIFSHNYWVKKLPKQTKITPTLSYAKNEDDYFLLKLSDGVIFSLIDMPYAVPRPKDIQVVISLPYSSKEWSKITPEIIDKALKENMSELYQHMLNQVPFKKWFFGSSNPKDVYAEITDIFFDTLGVKGSDKIGIGNKGIFQNNTAAYLFENDPYRWESFCLKDLPDVLSEYGEDRPYLVLQKSDWTPELRKSLDSFASQEYMDEEKMKIFFTNALHPFNPMNWAPDNTYTDVERYKQALIAWDD